jgi:hypothetical protein
MANPSATNLWIPVVKPQWKNAVNDLVTGGAVSIPTGCAVQFNFAFWDEVAPLVDANLINVGAAYSSIYFRILDPTLSVVYISQQIASGSFTACTTAQFQAMTNAQLQIFIPALSNVLTTSGGQGNFVLQVYGVDSDGASDPDILCQFQVNAYNTGIGITTPPASTATTSRGAQAIGSGVSSGTVTMNLAYVPTTVILTWQMPDANGLGLDPVLVGAPTAASFAFSLSGMTDRVGYVLHWQALQ